jgi:hypothetical protein
MVHLGSPVGVFRALVEVFERPDEAIDVADMKRVYDELILFLGRSSIKGATLYSRIAFRKLAYASAKIRKKHRRR